MIYYKKRFGIKTADIFHDNTEKPDRKVDVWSYFFVAKRENFRSNSVCSILLDLSKTEEELFSNFSKTTKYQINRAKKKDGIICATVYEPGNHNVSVLNDFLDFFNAFAMSKGLPSLSMRNLEQYIEMNTLYIRSASKDNEVLAMHLYDVSNNLAWLQRSCSLFRKNNDPTHKSLIGRANRLLHWEDCLFFKQKNLLEYNFGGFYTGNIDKELLMLNEFKDSFGGELKTLYSYMIPISPKGYVLIILRFLRFHIEQVLHFFKKFKLIIFKEKEKKNEDID